MPHGLEPSHEHFALAVLVSQNKYFEPFPKKIFELLDDEGTAILRYVLDQCSEKTRSFSMADAGTIHPDDQDFILYLMKPDLRDRPSAIETLTHSWLKDV